MAHEIILEKGNCAKKIAQQLGLTNLFNLLTTLMSKAASLHAKLRNYDKDNPQIAEINALLEEIQAVLTDMCDNSNLSGRETETQGLIDRCNAFLP